MATMFFLPLGFISLSHHFVLDSVLSNVRLETNLCFNTYVCVFVVVCSRLIFLEQIGEGAFGIVKSIYCLFQADFSGAD